MESLVTDYGLWILFAVIAIQAAGGGGLPGKTTLVIAGILAAKGKLEIWQVIAVAALAGIVGGYVGYAIGRFAGRRLVELRFVQARAGRHLERIEAFFEAHGTKAIFFARFLPGMKVVACPAAGAFGMRLVPFLLWHALAAISFAVVFGLTAFWAGEAAIELVEQWGLYGLIPAAVAVASLYVVVRRRRLPLEDPGPEGARS